MRRIVVTALVFALGGVVSATVLVPTDLGELSRDARAIARGRIVAVDAQWTEGRRTIETIVTLQTEMYLKGQLGETVHFRIPGGVLGRYRNIVVGAPQFVVGQRVIVFLGAQGPAIPHILGLSQGVFRLAQSADGNWLVTPSAILPSMQGPIVRGNLSMQPARLADFERDVRALADGPAMILSRRVRHGCCCALMILMSAGYPRPALAYLKFGFEVNGRQVALKWTTTPVRYFVSDQGVSGVSAADFQAAVGRAFATWQSVPTASISYGFGGFTSRLPGDDDGRSTLGFRSEPSLERVLASTSYLIDDFTGELLEADIFFNSAFPWSVAAGGERNRWDVESIAVHEIGHLNGLGHSAIGETEMVPTGRRVVSTGAVMFPIALGPGDISGRQLAPDDIAGVSDLYPDNDFSDDTGSVSGRVTKNGLGIFGAHVVAFDPGRGDLIGNFTLSRDGEFSIAGLRPGPHVIRVEPLDDADTNSFFDASEPVDLAFRAKYFERLVVVPGGGDSGAVTIAVGP